MSNIIPPLLSSSPPPIEKIDDDQFGDFTLAGYSSYGFDVTSPPQSPRISLNDKFNDDSYNSVLDKRKNELNIEPPLPDKYQDMPTFQNNISIPFGLSNGHAEEILNSSEIVPEVDAASKSEENIFNVIDRTVPLTNDFSYDDYREEPPEISDDIPHSNNHESLSFESSDSNYMDDIGDDLCYDVRDIEVMQEDFNEIERSNGLINNNVNESEVFEITEIEQKPDAVVVNSIISNKEIICDNTLLNENQCSEIEFSLSIEHGNTNTPEQIEVLNKTETDLDICSGGEDGSSSVVEPKHKDEANSDNNRHTVDNLEMVNATASKMFEDETDLHQSSDEFQTSDDFGNFANFQAFTNPDHVVKLSENDDDFGDFSTFSSSNNVVDKEQQLSDEDDFGDFTSVPSAPAKMNFMSLSSTEALEKSEEIIKQMFEVVNVEAAEFSVEGNTMKESVVFHSIKDITDTNALTYQWTKSSSQQRLLRALNIDIRNIIFGHGRQSSMPKFAANMGLTPLEPIKSDSISSDLLIRSSPVQPVPTSTTNEIPSAQFDWNESGLANPLEAAQANTILLDLDEFAASLDTTNSSPQNCHTPNFLFDDWSSEMQNVKKSEPSSKGDQTVSDHNFTLDSEISESKSQMANQIISNDNESVNSLQFIETPAELIDTLKHNKSTESFENIVPTAWVANNMMPLRESYINNVDAKSSEIEEPGWLKPTILTPVLPRKEIDEFGDFQSFEAADNAPSPLYVLPIETTSAASKTKTDDGFTSFHSGPTAKSSSVLPTTILEPIKTSSAISQINWPDPGITDEDLLRFESYSKANQETKQVVKNELATSEKKERKVIAKDLVLPILDSSPRKIGLPKPKAKSKEESDDDLWSDFVSSPAPAVKAPSFDTKRTSTPELSLSVPELSQIKPPKLPIPVITPQGLMQTKIPSVMPVIPQRPFQVPLHANPPQDGYRPSIISNQYAMPTSFSGMLQNNSFQTTTIPAYVKPPANYSHQSTPRASDDSDEWSDFVSSRPVNNLANVNHRAASNTHWNLRTNNAISQHQSANSISSITTLPNLDFVSPSTRGFRK